MRCAWSQREIDLLRAQYADTTAAQIARTLNRPVYLVYQKAYALGLRKSDAFMHSEQSGRLRPGSSVGLNGRFSKGHVPANKGLRRPGWAPGRMAETQFKKGQMHGAAQRKYKPVGTDRICADGYLERKVTDAGTTDRERMRRWVPVHRLVWIAAHGEIPPGHIVVFKPGMRSTVAAEITVDKLELITRVENMRRNTVHNLPAPLPELILLRAKLTTKINRRARAYEKQDARPA